MTENCSETNYPIKEFSGGIVLSVNLIYVLTSLSALIGNLLVIKVYSNVRYPNKLKSFLINLAIADILNGCLCIPFNYTELLYGKWIVHRLMCPIAQFVQYICVYVSAVTLIAISVERFVFNLFAFISIIICFLSFFAILYPLSTFNTFLSSHSNLILATIWLSGASYSSIGTESTKTVTTVWRNRTFDTCQQHVNQSPDIAKVFSFFNFSLTYAIPLLVMTILYTILVRKLIKVTNSSQISCSENRFDSENCNQLRRNSITFSRTKVCTEKLLALHLILCTPSQSA